MNTKLLAQSVDQIIGNVTPPPSLRNITQRGGAEGLSTVISNIIQIIFIFGGIAFVFMLILGSIQWIVSGGDKERVTQARGRITYALIGIFLLALSFVIIEVIGQITGFTFFFGQNRS